MTSYTTIGEFVNGERTITHVEISATGMRHKSYRQFMFHGEVRTGPAFSMFYYGAEEARKVAAEIGL